MSNPFVGEVAAARGDAGDSVGWWGTTLLLVVGCTCWHSSVHSSHCSRLRLRSAGFHSCSSHVEGQENPKPSPWSSGHRGGCYCLHPTASALTPPACTCSTPRAVHCVVCIIDTEGFLLVSGSEAEGHQDSRLQK